MNTFEPVAPQPAVVLHVPDGRFIGVAAPNVAAQTLGDVPLELVVIAVARASSASCCPRPGRNPYENPRKSCS